METFQPMDENFPANGWKLSRHCLESFRSQICLFGGMGNLIFKWSFVQKQLKGTLESQSKLLNIFYFRTVWPLYVFNHFTAHCWCSLVLFKFILLCYWTTSSLVLELGPPVAGHDMWVQQHIRLWCIESEYPRKRIIWWRGSFPFVLVVDFCQ